MKQIRIFALIALAVLTAACAKEIRTNNEEQEPSLNPNVIVFTANAPSKTAIGNDDETVTWVAGDEVRFSWDGGYAIAAAASSGATTTFTVEVDDNVDEIYAIYPASAGGSVNEGKVTVHYSGSRTDGTFAANDICVARAVKSGNAWNTSLAFKNAACVLKVGVTSNDIVKLRVEAVGGEMISGAYEVSMDGSGNPVVGAAVGTAGDKTSLTISGPGNYYIPIKPGVTLADGFRVSRFINDSDQVTPFYYYGSFTTERGTIIKLNDIDAHAGQYYVSPAGAGTKSGQSWTNAMDVDKFKAFVTNQDNHFLLKGSTFHFSADEFSFGDDYLELDYPDHGNVAFTLEGTMTASDTTTFIGRTNTSEVKAGVLAPMHNSYITVKNVKFTGTDGASNSSVIRVNHGAKEFTLDHCYFRGNKTAGNGGSISLLNDAHLIIKNCSFSGNRGAGAVLHVNNTSANVDILDTEIKGNFVNSIYGQNVGEFNLTRVLFKGNYADDESGAAGWFENGGTYTFTDCDFIDNYCDWRGGAVVFYKVQATITGGKFQGNHADGDGNDYAGGAIYVYGTNGGVECSNVLFKDNYSFVKSNTNAGGIIRLKDSGNFAYFDHCVFDNNWSCRSASSNNSCAAIINCRNGGTIFYFNACEFKNNSSGRGWSSGNQQGGKNGQVMAVWASATIGMNNCSIHDNFASRNVDDGGIPWIHMGNGGNKLLMSNCSVIGDQIRRPEDEDQLKSRFGVIYLEANGSYYLINNILCSKYSDGASVRTGGTGYIEVDYYNKTSPGKDSDVWTALSGSGSGYDYWADSSCFGNWSAPYTWNGTLTGTNSSMKAATADVNSEIQSADADFYAWLNSIGALGKDINGNSRGATSWPGCYQN